MSAFSFSSSSVDSEATGLWHKRATRLSSESPPYAFHARDTSLGSVGRDHSPPLAFKLTLLSDAHGCLVKVRTFFRNSICKFSLPSTENAYSLLLLLLPDMKGERP